MIVHQRDQLLGALLILVIIKPVLTYHQLNVYWTCVGNVKHVITGIMLMSLNSVVSIILLLEINFYAINFNLCHDE